jgi:XapX domain-containing protein
MQLKIALGLVLGFGIGYACRVFAVPVPAPPTLFGASLVCAMTAGYLLMDRWMQRKGERPNG